MGAHSKAAPLVEVFGVHNLPLGGKNGYKGVRVHRKGFQGYTPKKTHTTAEYATAQEAAIALAQKKFEVKEGLHSECTKRKPRALKASICSGSSAICAPRMHSSQG